MINSFTPMDLVTIQTFDNYFSANIQLTRLRDAGVECYLKDEYTVTIDPILSNAIGGIKLVVKKSDEQEVKKLLQEFKAPINNPVLCPQCGSAELISVAEKSPENLFTVISTWLLSSYAVSVQNIYKCSDCGYQSKTLPEDLSSKN
jgi:catabolite regulation protein CreA